MENETTLGQIFAKLEKKSDITPELVRDITKETLDEINDQNPALIEKRNFQIKAFKKILRQYYAYIFPVDSNEPVIAVPIQEEENEGFIDFG